METTMSDGPTTTARRIVLVVCSCLLVTMGCSKGSTPKATTPAPAIEASDEGDVQAAPKKPTKAELYEKFAKKKKEIVVGGCTRACKEPTQAFNGFLDALTDGDPATSFVPFVDTSRLVYNGVPRGTEWAMMWKDAKLQARKDSIAEWATGFSAWVSSIHDPADIATTKKSGVKIDAGTESATVWYTHPSFEGDTTVPVWRFVLEPRGLEWLVIAIDTTGA